MSRKISRELCMKLFYQFEITKEFSKENIERFIEENSHEKLDLDYMQDIGNLFIEKKEEIDSLITKYAKGWKLERIGKVDLGILRVAITEMLYKEDVPYKVSINEAIELSKRYCDEESASFINGILGSVINGLEK